MPTKIPWADEVWNPVTGCTPISEGCKHCYAERMAKRLAGRFGYPANEPFRVTLHPDRLEQPLRWRKPRRVFVCSMGDLFHEDVSREYTMHIFNVMGWYARQHTFMILTKRVRWMRDFITWYSTTCTTRWPYPNIWLGVSAENQKRADERIPILLHTPAAKAFVSFEPLLSGIDLSAYLYCGLSWCVIGGESGPGARPMDPQWARSIRDQCKTAGVSFFFKAMSGRAPIPDDLMIREFPR